MLLNLLLEISWLQVLLLCSDASYICGNSTIECDDLCQTYMKIFPNETNESTWGLRHDAIARIYRKRRVKISVEIGIARGGLS